MVLPKSLERREHNKFRDTGNNDPNNVCVAVCGDDGGPVPVDISGSTSVGCLSDDGAIAGTTSFTTIATIPLTNSKVYKEIGWIVSCFRPAIFEIIHDDDGVENNKGTIRTDRTDNGELSCARFTSGATGTQTLLIRGRNLVSDDTSDMSAFLSVNEEQ